MIKENLFKRIWNAILLFISTIIGRESRIKLDSQLIEMAKLNQQASESAIAMSKFAEAIKKLGELIKQQHLTSLKLVSDQTSKLNQIKNKAHFPVLINSKGKLLNLSSIKRFSIEMDYSVQDKSINVSLKFDDIAFDKYSLLVASSYEGSLIKPLFDYAGRLFSEYKKDFTDECILGCEAHLIASANLKEILLHKDIIEAIGQAIIGTAKPYYVKENNLKDFDYEKGPVYKEEEKKAE